MSDITESVIEDATLRDTLLPKLISGEVRVKDAEGFIRDRGL
jgi:type I restriction enzyme S subunit